MEGRKSQERTKEGRKEKRKGKRNIVNRGLKKRERGKKIRKEE